MKAFLFLGAFISVSFLILGFYSTIGRSYSFAEVLFCLSAACIITDVNRVHLRERRKNPRKKLRSIQNNKSKKKQQSVDPYSVETFDKNIDRIMAQSNARTLRHSREYNLEKNSLHPLEFNLEENIDQILEENRKNKRAAMRRSMWHS